MTNFSQAAKRSLRPALIVAMGCMSIGAMAAGAAVRPSDVAGRYSVLRAGDKDTGCMLTLDARARGPGGFRALLAPACRDQGLVIFDPVGWTIERGRLALTARKGHKARFDREADGVWRRDAEEGKALALKPL